jgi:hypothetical protein
MDSKINWSCFVTPRRVSWSFIFIPIIFGLVLLSACAEDSDTGAQSLSTNEPAA